MGSKQVAIVNVSYNYYFDGVENGCRMLWWNHIKNFPAKSKTRYNDL